MSSKANKYKNKNKNKHKTLPMLKNMKVLWLLLIILFILLICGCLYLPLTYSTVHNKNIIDKISSNLLGEANGIYASDQDIQIGDSEVYMKCSNQYMIDSGDAAIKQLKELQSLGVIKTNIDLHDAWSVYYQYYVDNYNDNIDTLYNVASWFIDMNSTVDTEELDCDGDCRFCKEYELLLKDGIDVYNSQAHKNYHQYIKDSIVDLELDSEEEELAYEAYIITNPAYIKRLKLKFTIINQNLLENNTLANWAAHGNKHLVNFQLGPISYSKEFTNANDIEQICNYISLVQDEKVYDSKLMEMAPKSFLTVSTDENGFTSNDMSVYKINSGNTTEWLKTHNYSKNAKPKADILSSTQAIDLGYGMLYWEIEEIEHIDNIPTFEELYSSDEWDKVLSMLIEQTVWQILYGNEDIVNEETDTDAQEIENTNDSILDTDNNVAD